ncbi:MAG: HAD-IA family hydrolase [Alistipes sp.]|nr:HAD-IA family hydrolase [Alistipes sp.]
MNNNLPKKAAIFDMDGTLVDNSAVHVRAFELFCNRYGVKDWRTKLEKAFGMGSDDIMRMLLPEEVIRERGLQALGDEKEEIYRTIYAPEIAPVKGLKELLELLRGAGIRCAVGSSGCRQNVEFVLSSCKIEEYFEVKVSGDMVSRCKPEPEIYLTAAKALGVKPEECIIFEDARAGFEAARRAGAGAIVAIATTLPSEVIRAEKLADVVVEDFSEITTIEQLG